MKQTIRIYVAATVCILGVMPMVADGQEIRIVPYDPTTMSYPISPAQAIASARAWRGDPELPLTLEGVRQLSAAPGRATYVLASPDGQEYDVRCDDGAVSRWHDAAAVSAWAEAKRLNVTPAYSAEQVGATATAFAAQRYSGYAERHMQCLRNDGHTVEFVTVLPGQVFDGGNYCSVAVSEFTGAVVSFTAAWSDAVSIATVPTVSASVAESSALVSALANPSVYTVFTTGPTSLWLARDGLGMQRLTWVVALAASKDASFTYEDYASGRHVGLYHADVYVDAQTGEAYGAEEFLGAPSAPISRAGWQSTRRTRPSRALPRRDADILRLVVAGQECLKPCYPPLTISGRAWIHVGYLGTKPLSARFAWSDGTVHVAFGDGGRAIMRPGDRNMLVRGVRHRVSAPVRLYRSRTYVPLDAWEILTGWTCRWLPESRTVSLDPPAPKTAITAGQP